MTFESWVHFQVLIDELPKQNNIKKGKKKKRDKCECMTSRIYRETHAKVKSFQSSI